MNELSNLIFEDIAHKLRKVQRLILFNTRKQNYDNLEIINSMIYRRYMLPFCQIQDLINSQINEIN
jgi:hypothetical protein